MTPTADLLEGEMIVEVFAGSKNSILVTSLNRVLFIGSNEYQSNPLLTSYYENSDKLFDILPTYFEKIRNQNINPIEVRSKSLINMLANNQAVIDSINQIKNEAIAKINLETDYDKIKQIRIKAIADLNKFVDFLENTVKDVELVLPNQSIINLETSFNIIYKQVDILTQSTSIGSKLTTFDLNGDGIEEITTIYYNEALVADIDASSETNKYVDSSSYYYEGNYYDFLYKDVDNDGYEDKFEIFDFYGVYFIEILKNNQNGQFEFIYNNFYYMDTRQPNIVHQDINFDGLDEIIYVNSDQKLVVFLNLGEGKFSGVELLETNAIKTFEVKFNDGTKGILYQQEDGQIKIVTLSFNDLNEVIITEKMTGAVVSTESTLSIFDYDNDGNDDFIVHEGSDVFVYRASTSYQQKETIEVNNIRQVITEDIDFDGKLELILVKENYESLLIYKNNKFEVLATFENIPTGNYVISFKYFFGSSVHTLVLIEQDTKEIITFEAGVEKYINNLEEQVNELNIEYLGIYDNKEFTGDSLTNYSSKVSNSNRLYVKGLQPNSYTNTFDTKGGSLLDSLTLEEGSTIVIDSIPTKEGYIFNGWKETIPQVMPGNNLVLTATWLKYESVNDNAIVTGLDQAVDPSDYENQNIEVKVDVEVLPNNNVLATEVNLIEAAIKNILKYGSFETFYLDITLHVENLDTGDKWYLTTTDNMITFQIDVPSKHQGKLNYKIIRIHDGVAEVLETTYNEITKKVEFKSDKFSTYALVYETNNTNTLPPVDNGNNDNTQSDKNNTYLYVAVIGLSILIVGFLLWFFLMKKNKKEDNVETTMVADDNDDFILVGGKERHKMSFKAKLSLSSENIRDKYAMIKSTIYQLEPAETRISFKHESLIHKNRTILKIRIRGKALHLYARLPLKLVNKLNVKNVSDIKTYEDTPLLLVITEKNTLDQAYQLIEILKEFYNLNTVDRTIDALKEHPVLSQKKLIEMGLIRKEKLIGKYYLD